MPPVASPGHKLGQMIGNLFEEFFAPDLQSFCKRHGFYCDRRGLRPSVRGSSTKVCWVDKYGNKHDLDYVIESGGSYDKQGEPVAFIELAWRRYTKHSRNKTGELEGSLLHLRDTYQTRRFLGAILAGEYTDGGKKQLTSHGVTVLHIPFQTLAACFRMKGVELDYPEDASPEWKAAVIRQWEKLTLKDMKAIKAALLKAVREDYSAFRGTLEKALLRKVEAIYVLPLYGRERVYRSLGAAARAVERFKQAGARNSAFVKFELQIRFSDGDKIEGSFHTQDEALRFLGTFS